MAWGKLIHFKEMYYPKVYRWRWLKTLSQRRELDMIDALQRKHKATNSQPTVNHYLGQYHYMTPRPLRCHETSLGQNHKTRKDFTPSEKHFDKNKSPPNLGRKCHRSAMKQRKNHQLRRCLRFHWACGSRGRLILAAGSGAKSLTAAGTVWVCSSWISYLRKVPKVGKERWFCWQTKWYQVQVEMKKH